MSDTAHDDSDARRPTLSLVVDGRRDGTAVGHGSPALPGVALEETVLLLDTDREPDTVRRKELGTRYGRVAWLSPGQDVSDLVDSAGIRGDWVLVLGPSEMAGVELLNGLDALLDTVGVDQWRLNCLTVHPDGMRWLSQAPWSPVREPRLFRTSAARSSAVRDTDLAFYRLELAAMDWESRWRRALREEVLRTADRDSVELRGFSYWLPERRDADEATALPPPDREALRRLLPDRARPVRPRPEPDTGTAAGDSDPHDDLRLLTMPGLSAGRRRSAVTVERLRPATDHGGIPRTIHQVWLGGRPVPPDFLRYAQSWRDHHPDWTYRLWTEDNLPELECARVLHRARFFAEQADVVRLELLTRFGGVYVDMDFECLGPLDPLLKGVGAFAGLERAGWVGNAILGSAASHPAYRFALEQAIDLVGRGKHAVEATGPFMISRVLAEFPSVTLFAPEILYPVAWNDRSASPVVSEAAVAVHHWALSHLRPPGSDDVAAVARALRPPS